MSFTTSQALLISFTVVLSVVGPTFARKQHVIDFRSPNLYPESIAWDPSAQHFVVGSLRHRTIISVSDAGVVDTFISDPTLPPNSAVLGVAIDTHLGRLLAVVRAPLPHSAFNALAAYDLRSRRRLFLAPLTDPSNTTDRAAANDVTFDFSGNAYVTNSAGNFIWKVNIDGEPSIFSRSPIFTSHPVDRDLPYHYCGLNGVVYNSKGYLLVVQTNTAKMFKVNVDDGTARTVLLNRDLTAADGMAVRSDGVVLVASQHKLYFVKSDSSWAEGVVYDETALDSPGFATSVAVGGEDRVYVLYGYVDEVIMGKEEERESFRIVEIESEKESGEEAVWVFVLIGFGLAYFLFWRFQMRQVVANMNKKTV